VEAFEDREKLVPPVILAALRVFDPAAVAIGRMTGVYFGLTGAYDMPGRRLTWYVFRGYCTACRASASVTEWLKHEDVKGATPFGLPGVVEARMFREFTAHLAGRGCPHGAALWSARQDWWQWMEALQTSRRAAGQLAGRLRAAAESVYEVLVKALGPALRTALDAAGELLTADDPARPAGLARLTREQWDDVRAKAAGALDRLTAAPPAGQSFGIFDVPVGAASGATTGSCVTTTTTAPAGGWPYGASDVSQATGANFRGPLTPPGPPRPPGVGEVWEWDGESWSIKRLDDGPAPFLDEQQADRRVGAGAGAAGVDDPGAGQDAAGFRVTIGRCPDLCQGPQQPAGVAEQVVRDGPVGGVRGGDQVTSPQRAGDVQSLDAAGDDDLRPLFVQKPPDV
jgi:hypothetical protein